MERYPAFAYLAGAHLHQDWDADFASPAEVVADFARTESRACVEQLRRDLDEILAAQPSESELASLLRELELEYYPATAGLTNAGWLSWLRDQLERP